MCEIKILHLSDFHFKLNGNDDHPIREKVKDEMLKAIKTHIKDHGAPGFVAVTGDIAFSGKKKEYGQAFEFFNKLRGIIPTDPHLLIVPGNHDVDRAKIGKFFSIQENIIREDRIIEFLKAKDEFEIHVSPKFTAFKEFAQKLDKTFYPDPADFYWVKVYKEQKVAFLGLNSCWACEGDNDRFNIALGYQQIKEANEKTQEMPLRIGLMHHPQINWLIDLEKGECRQELFGHCHLLLHGHIHSDQVSYYLDPVDSILCLGANAAYKKNKNEFIGFQFISIKPKGDDFSFEVCPYILDKARNYEFIPDTNRDPKQKKEECFELIPYQVSVPSIGLPIAPLKIPQDYQNWIGDMHSNLPIEQLARQGEVFTVPLPRVFIPLDTTNPFYDEEMIRIATEEKGKFKRMGANGIEKESELNEPDLIDIETLLSRQNTILLRGQPGMGKTTLAKHLAYSMVYGLGEPALQGYLPVLIFLKGFWPLFGKALTTSDKGLSFISLLPSYLLDVQCPLNMNIVKEYMSQGRAVFLFDGLDEVPDYLRPAIVDSISRFRAKHRNNRFLVTGRPHSIDNNVMRSFGKYLQDILPLDKSKIENFIIAWFQVICSHALGDAKKTAEELITDITLNENVEQFIKNPLLLTAICILYQSNKKLPDQRAELYDRVSGNLLHKKFADPKDRDKPHRIEAFLMRLAFYMHEKKLKNIEVSSAKDILKDFYLKEDGEKFTKYNLRINQLIEEIEPNCGLLKRLSSGDIEFFHLTFQEFMVAKYLIDNDLEIIKYIDDPWWEEVILLYIGLVSMDRKLVGNQLVRGIIEFKDEDLDRYHRRWLLGAKALKDMLDFKRGDDAITLSKDKLKAVIAESENVKYRFQAGEILGALGDDRFDQFEMIEIPEGEFYSGTKEGKGKPVEYPLRKIFIDEFRIGKNPVTNDEFREFVESGGYRHKEFWTPEGFAWLNEEKIFEPNEWHNRRFNGPNFPVAGVSWYEAMAFCKWLSLEKKKNYRLPTEAEWEKASRGGGVQIWPWGRAFNKDLCNSLEADLGRTSPVGIFPKGASAFGCNDMAGNVWEWCQDWFDADYYKIRKLENPTGPENGVHRVVRGGSWIRVKSCSRCAFRGNELPTRRDSLMGFRLAMSD